MARSDLIKEMMYRNYSPLDFNFWGMQAPPLYSLVSQQDVYYIHNIITSPKYASKIDYKNQAIDYTMKCRGFRKLHAGTNRVVYKHEEIPSIVMKIPTREVALTDGPREYKNQYYLQPFVTRIFEHTQCGTMALAERVQPITSIPEYMSLSDSVFELLVNKVLGKYVLEDIGTLYFKNIGIRDGFGPVLVDFPLMYKLDGQKLYCNKIHLNGQVCDGVIDYDEGFNKLICKKCGQRYYASELAKNEAENNIVKGIYSKGDCNMEIVIKRGREVVCKTGRMTETIKSNVLDNIQVEVIGRTKEEPVIENNQYTTNTEENYIKIPRKVDGEPSPEYLNIESYGTYRLVEEVETPSDNFMNSPEMVKPSEDDYDNNGKFILEGEKEHPQPVDARMDFVEDNDNDKTHMY